jgi:hypothetical protein
VFLSSYAGDRDQESLTSWTRLARSACLQVSIRSISACSSIAAVVKLQTAQARVGHVDIEWRSSSCIHV